MTHLSLLIATAFLHSVNSMPAGHTGTGVLPPSHIVVAPFSNLAEVTNNKIAQIIQSKVKLYFILLKRKYFITHFLDHNSDNSVSKIRSKTCDPRI